MAAVGDGETELGLNKEVPNLQELHAKEVVGLSQRVGGDSAVNVCVKWDEGHVHRAVP